MNLFGRKKPEAPPPPTTNAGPTVSASSTLNAITKLRDAGDTLDKREDYLNNKIKKETDEAKKLMGQNKKAQALQCIKRKKMYEGQVEKIGQARLNLETQQLALEQLNLNKEVVEAQREGAKTMASVTAQMGAIEDAQADANDIAEALGRPMAGAYDMDDSDLALGVDLSELKGLDAPSVPSSKPMPSAPTGKERELAELEASMAM